VSSIAGISRIPQQATKHYKKSQNSKIERDSTERTVSWLKIQRENSEDVRSSRESPEIRPASLRALVTGPLSLSRSCSTPADVTTALTAIVSQMAEGEITPEEAAVAASVIETKRKALETEELDRRVAVLEQQLAKGK